MHNTYTYELISSRLLNKADVHEWVLQPTSRGMPFRAGQYIALSTADSGPIYYSIACAPTKDGVLRLFVSMDTRDPAVLSALQTIQKTKQVTCQGPYGDATYQYAEGLQPIIAVSRTGISQASSWIEAAIEASDTRSWELVWQWRSEEDAFCFDLLQEWMGKMPTLKAWSTHVLPAHPKFSGLTGTICSHLQARTDIDWSRVQLYSSGSFGFNDGLFDALVPQGLTRDRWVSDRLATRGARPCV